MELKNYHKKFEELPESTQDYLLSPDTIKLIHDAGKSEGLLDGEIALFTKITTDVLMGSIKEVELFQKIEGSFGVSQTTAQNLTNKLINTVLPSIKAGLDQTLQTETIATAPIKQTLIKDESVQPTISTEQAASLRPTFAPPPVVPQKQQESPTPKAQEESEPAHEAPFILHKEEEIEPAKEATKTQYNTQRPAFYKPTFSEEYKKSMLGAESARIELGEESTPREPKPGKTKNQETRIVHYSEFRTPLDPFAGTQEQQAQITKPEEPKESPAQKPEVHPNNVVDLKDLPLE